MNVVAHGVVVVARSFSDVKVNDECRPVRELGQARVAVAHREIGDGCISHRGPPLLPRLSQDPETITTSTRYGPSARPTHHIMCLEDQVEAQRGPASPHP